MDLDGPVGQAAVHLFVTRESNAHGRERLGGGVSDAEGIYEPLPRGIVDHGQSDMPIGGAESTARGGEAADVTQGSRERSLRLDGKQRTLYVPGRVVARGTIRGIFVVDLLPAIVVKHSLNASTGILPTDRFTRTQNSIEGSDQPSEALP